MLYHRGGGVGWKSQLSFSIKVLVCFLQKMSQLLDTVFNVPQHFETAGSKILLIREMETFLALNARLLLLLKIILFLYY